MVDEIITPDRVLINLKVENKKDLLLELCENLKIKNWRKIHKLVIKREKIMSTGIGDGIAIPRATSEILDKPTGCLAILKHPVNYDSLDKRPISIALLLALPANYKKYGAIIATFVELLSQESIRKHLLSAKSKKEALRILSSREEE